jgi:hypothetical protein
MAALAASAARRKKKIESSIGFDADKHGEIKESRVA